MRTRTYRPEGIVVAQDTLPTMLGEQESQLGEVQVPFCVFKQRQVRTDLEPSMAILTESRPSRLLKCFAD